MNARSVLTLATLVLAPLTTQALTLNDDFNLDMTLGVFSDYRSRGISQTLGDPAAQAGATLVHSSGLYVGAWTSNVDFGGEFKTRQELEYYAGYYWQATEAISLDLGYIKYDYPKEGQFNMSEVYAILDVYGVKLGANYSNDTPNLFGEDQDTLYTYLNYKIALPADIGLDLRVGRNDVKDPALATLIPTCRKANARAGTAMVICAPPRWLRALARRSKRSSPHSKNKRLKGKQRNDQGQR
jgi:uncharacterized protein (TIGR02001 family)